jgi:ATP-dependent exoDNAse (exonuclease V) beta subunit
MPSITTVLGFTEPEEKKESLKRWQEALGPVKSAQVSQAATTRGTNVHLLCERFLKGEAVDAPIGGKPVPYADMQSFNALKLKLNKITDVWGQEVALYSTTLELAGRCDLIGVYKGTPGIIDFKTSSKVKGDKDIHSYKLQLCFYGTSHNQMFGTDIKEGVILMVAETGFPMEFSVPFTNELRQELKDRSAKFYQAAMQGL